MPNTADRIEPPVPVIDPRAVEARQIRLVFAQAPVTLVASLFVLALSVALFQRFGIGTHLFAWAATVFAIAIGRVGLVVAFHLARPDDSAIGPWRNALIASAAVAGLSWGGVMFLIDPQTDVTGVILVAAATISVASGSIATNGAHFGMFIAFLVGIVSLPSTMLLTYPDWGSRAAGLLLAAFGIAVAVLGRAYTANIRSAIIHELSTRELERSLVDSVEQLALRSVAEARHQRLFEQGPVVLFQCSPRSGWPIRTMSPNATALGVDPVQLVRGRIPLGRLIHPADAAVIFSRAREMPPSAFGMDVRLGTGAGSGRLRWAYCYVVPTVEDDGRVTGYQGFLLYISSRKDAEAEVRREKERAQVTLASIGDAVITVDAGGRVEFMNPVAETLTGWTLARAADRPIAEILQLIGEHDGEPVENPVERALGGRARSGPPDNARLQRADGMRFDIAHTAAPIRAPDQSIAGAVLVFHDSTEVRAMARELSYRASHDPLTDLLNRREFESRIARALEDATAKGARHVLVYLDLDQFKIVNDTAGHRAGDDLLQQVAGVLRSRLRSNDVLARLGGDEFGALIYNCPVERGVDAAETMRNALTEYRFNWGDRYFDVGMSAGVVAIDAQSRSVEELLAAADLACYAAKDAGRNRVHVYEPSDADLQRRHGEMEWVARIRAAIAADRFVLYRQPIVAVDPGSDHTVEHFEVLLRMIDEEGQIVSIDQFLSAAERFSLMREIDRLVIARVFRWHAAHQDTGERLVSVNLSGASLNDDSLREYVLHQADVHGLGLDWLCFEVTETAAISNLGPASELMYALKAQGCHFALDDFGIGLSSFAYLKHLPVDFLKIDGAFVRDMLVDPLDSAVVAAINEIGHVMKLRTVAEYVESKAILKALRPLGVDFAQGQAVGLPEPLEPAESDAAHVGQSA